MPAIREEMELRPGIRDDDDEGLFARDVGGQLVRLDAPTESDYDKKVTVQIDGKPVTVPLAEPLKDAQGNIVLDLEGRTTPRYTTIYDAATKLYVKEPGDEAKIPIPTLCHQPHMTPVAVCRLCVVQIYGTKRGKRAAERKLLPACQHQVKDGMEVFTMYAPGADGERVRKAVTLMTELLTAEHLKPPPLAGLAPFNELQQMSDRCEIKSSRFSLPVMGKTEAASPTRALPAHRPLDNSSPVFLVDHSACILCDRCWRACDEVKKNNVIGRTGKGATAGISFDLDTPMGDSTCVQCGECMVSCPTTAITYKPVATVKIARQDIRGGRAEILCAEELKKDPLFAGVPPKFLLWQEGLVVRRRVKAGEVLCRQGEPGNTAFVMKQGKLRVTVWPPEHSNRNGKGLLGLLVRGKPMKPLVELDRGPADVILGEMACLSGTPRNADVTALEDGEIWEVRRNVLDRIMRSPTQRPRFEKIYRERALDAVLRKCELFEGLAEDEYKRCVEFLRPRLTFVRVDPGQALFEQGDWADCLYLVRLGHVRIGIGQFGSEATVLYRGPGTVIGEIGLLALSREDLRKKPTEVDREINFALADAPNAALSAALPAGRRTATCSALDHLELARLDRREFLQMVRDFSGLRRRLIDMSLNRLRGTTDDRPLMRQYIEQGLYQAQSLLALDLIKCVHCDECTKACIQQHGSSSHGAPITRLLREGLEFDRFLVTSSCRSCKDAWCMIGCPVDSIHRGKHQQIVIEDHCIGCGLCASNCPFGNIFMIPDETHRFAESAPDAAPTRKAVPYKAATCDQCDAGGDLDVPVPRCVYACPHDAAHRMTGEELLRQVTGGERNV